MLKIAQLMFIILMFTHPHTPHTSPPPEELGVGPTLPHPIGYSILFEKWYDSYLIIYQYLTKHDIILS